MGVETLEPVRACTLCKWWEEWPYGGRESGWCMRGGCMLITITRTNKSVDGTFGTLVIDTSPFKCITLEKSSTIIPAGVVYDVLFMWSDNFQQIMPHIIVPGRTAIEIHWANWPYQLEGCTALGDQEDFAQDMIEESKDAWIAFAKAITDQPSIKIKYVEDFA